MHTILALLILALSLAACRTAPSYPVTVRGPGEPAQAASLDAASSKDAAIGLPDATKPPAAPLPEQLELTPGALATAVPVSGTSHPTSELDAVEISTLQVCSPLAATPLEMLGEIISDPYNPPPPGRDERHQGVDFAYYQRFGRDSIAGETVQALLPGVVAFAQGDRLPYGNVVIIETLPDVLPVEITAQLDLQPGEALYLLYAHLQEEPFVVQEQSVACGQPIGLAGQTGYNIPVAHLHLEVRIGPAGVRFGGMAFYDTRATQAEMDTYQRWRMSGEFRHLDPMRLVAAQLAPYP